MQLAPGEVVAVIVVGVPSVVGSGDTRTRTVKAALDGLPGVLVAAAPS